MTSEVHLRGMSMTDAEITQIVQKVLADRLAPIGLKSSRAFSDIDFDGTPIVRVTADYARRQRKPTDDQLEAAHLVREKLLERGDDRFVFVTSTYPDDEDDEDDD